MSKTNKKTGRSIVTDDASRAFLATLGRWTGGLSPQAFGGAWLSVLARLATAPGRQAQMARSALQKSLALAQFAGTAVRGGGIAPEAAGTPYQSRFSDPAWAKFPFNVLAQSFLTASDWAREAVKNVPGAQASAENIVGFTVREGLELVAPDNYLPTNPQLIGKTMEEKGRNLVRGVKHLAEDVVRNLRGQGPVGVENYVVGEQIASTRGKVILRTPLMELIQYAPQTKSVYAEPVLIVPAWIMKYYILDLSPQNSLVNYLTGLGHTVFMVSWKNPTAEDRDITMDDYLASGVFAALDAVGAVLPKRRIHAVGYCIGGTLLAIAAAALAAKDDSVHFILAGDSMVASNAQMSVLVKSELRDKVHLLGRREDIPRLLAAMDIATSASAYGEGFSNAVGEAMACGVPCVVTDVGDAGWIVGDTGVVVPPGSPELLADAWNRLLDMDLEQRKRLGERARKRVAENFEINKVVRRFEDFYRGLQRMEA